MLPCCPTFDCDFMKDKFDIQVAETEKGIRIEVIPKDPSKKKAFQEMVKTCKEFCDCEC